MSSQDRRIWECMQILRGKPLVKAMIRETPWPEEGRPEIARYYSESIVNFAIRVFLNEEAAFYGEANDALYENAHYYRTHREVRDDRDSYYWHLGEEARLLLHYGRFGDRKKGLLREDAELEMVRMMAEYNHDNCRMDYFEQESGGTWKVHESENHHIQRNCGLWLQAKIMLLYPEVAGSRCADGHSPEEHLKAAGEYLKRWICERGSKSLFIECASDTYSCHTLKNLYHIYDFADEDTLKRLAGSLIDLYYGTVAQEQFAGCRGGGQARVYPRCHVDGYGGCDLWHYCALGVGHPAVPMGNDFTMLDSTYRCPELIGRLAGEYEARGTYEILSRPPGLADSENSYPLYSLEKGWGGIVRYSYCTPGYIMGTLHYHRLPVEKWTMISSQNRIQGVTFAADRDARIILYPCLPSRKPCYNHWVSAQKGSCLISMPMEQAYAWGSAAMNVWVSGAGGLADRLCREGNWLFTCCGDVYAALYVQGSYTISEDCAEECVNPLRPRVSGARIQCLAMESAVILELGDREHYGSQKAFREAVVRNEQPFLRGDTLCYRSLQKHAFAFGQTRDAPILIDGADPAAEIGESYKSPFLNGIWGQPEVTLSYDGEEIRWCFSEDSTLKRKKGEE